MENITSEQQLQQLLEEGKITREEYQELLDAIKKKTVGNEDYSRNTENYKSKSTLGKIAFVLMLIGIILPPPCFLIIQAMAPPNAEASISPWFYLGLIFEIIALTIGIKSWRNDYGKAAAIASGIIILLSILLIT